MAYDKPLWASLDGFTLHAATRAGAPRPYSTVTTACTSTLGTVKLETPSA